MFEHTLTIRTACCRLLNKALFDEPSIEEGAGGLVLVRDIDFASLSLDTLLPFYGRCHIAYIPSSGVVLGLSKLARLTKLCAKQLQTQESLARHVLHVLQSQLQPRGAVVVVQARHLVYTSAQPPQQRVTAAASGCLAATPACKAGAADTSLEEVLDLLGLQDTVEVGYLQDPNRLCLTATGSTCTCSSSNFNPFGSSCVSCGSSRLEPSILRGISASAGVGIDHDDSPLAPVTPDPSENDDTDSSEQGSVHDADCTYSQQGILGLGFSSSSCRSIGDDCDANGTDSMETAMQLLLTEAGVDVASAAVQTALRRHVMALLAATSGYLQEQPSRPVRNSSQLQQQLAQQEFEAVAGGCSCCGNLQQLQWQPTAEDQQQSQQQQQQLDESLYQQYVHSIPFMSQCEHHMLPFHGTAHISYLLPKSKTSCSSCNTTAAGQQAPLTQQEAEQLVQCYTKRLQVQERITHQVADAVNRLLQPAGVMVVISAVHMCMVARGVENHAGSTGTRAAFGLYQKNAGLRCRFLRSLQQQNVQQQQR